MASETSAWTIFKRIIVSFCAFCMLGLSIAIIVIVATKLDGEGVIAEYITIGSAEKVGLIPSCLMATEDYVAEICDYAYGVTSIAMATTMILALFLFCSWDMCGSGWVEFILGSLLTLWWTCAGIVFSSAATWSNDRNWPRESWRNSIPIMSWAAVLLAGTQTVVYAIDTIRCCAKCCGQELASLKAKRDKDIEKGKEKDMGKDTEKGNDKQKAETPKAAPQPPVVPPAQQMGKDDAVEAAAQANAV